MLIQTRRFSVILLIVAVILSIPAIAMQFTNEVQWSLSDFVLMGVLLLGTGTLCELVLNTVKRTEYRIGLCLALLFLLLLVWIELAVGLFGTPFAGS